jgi:transposase-like protein
MDFPILDFMDEEACYAGLLKVLHPSGLACPDCGRSDALGVHRRHRAPVLDYQCGHCHRVFNAFTGTEFQGTHRRPSELLLMLRGIAQGVSTAQLARELDRHRGTLLDLRHRLQENAAGRLDRTPLKDGVVEADEMYQNAGEKRPKTQRPGRSAATTGQRRQRPRHVGQRPPAGAGRGRA